VRCPACGHDKSKVIDSRMVDEVGGRRRRHVCGACDRRYTTLEIYESSSEIQKKMVFARRLQALERQLKHQEAAIKGLKGKAAELAKSLADIHFDEMG